MLIERKSFPLIKNCGTHFIIGRKSISMTHNQTSILAQWLISKTIPIYKSKGEKTDIENFRPISNLCSVSKIFEKLIRKRFLDIMTEQDADLTGNPQHGFKKSRSTTNLYSQFKRLLHMPLMMIIFI